MRKKLIACLTLIAMLICMLPVTALAVEPDLRVTDFARTTTKGRTLNFTLDDFTENFSDTSANKLPLETIVIESLPTVIPDPVEGGEEEGEMTRGGARVGASAGTLRIGSTPVVAGQIIPRDSIGNLNFVPDPELPAFDREGNEISCTFSWSATVNYNGSSISSKPAPEPEVRVNTGISTVTITIRDPKPVAKTDQTLLVYINTAKTGRLEATDERSRPLTYSLNNLPKYGTISDFNPATGDFTYTPKENFKGEDHLYFTVTVTAGGANAQFDDKGHVTITVADPAPTAIDTTVNVTINTLAKGFMKAEDARGRELTFEAVTQPERGTFTLLDAKTGHFSYMPEKAFEGTDSFTFRVSAGGQNSKIATVTLKIGNAPDPMAYADLVSPWDWAAYSAGMLGTSGVVIGEEIYGKHYFYPDRLIKRADYILMVCAAFDIEPDPNTTTIFADKDMPSWLVGFANAAYKANLVNGDTVENEVYLYPHAVISRIEAIKILDGALKVTNSTTEIPFTDVDDIPQWGMQSVRNMYQYGIIQGNSNGTLRPQEQINRAEAAQMIYQAYKYNLQNPRTRTQMY